MHEYDKELHTWNETLQMQNKQLTEELQQERVLREQLEKRVKDLENSFHGIDLSFSEFIPTV